MNRAVLFAVGGLATVYLINVATVALYKAATDERMHVLTERVESLARLNKDTDRIGLLNELINKATFSPFTTSAPYAISARNAVTRHLRTQPHLSLNVAIDEKGPDRIQVLKLLQRVNAELIQHNFSIGLAAGAKTVSIPSHLTRSDMLFGVTTGFEGGADYHVAFTSKRCRYLRTGSSGTQPLHNRVYSFGRRGLTVIDSFKHDEALARQLAVDFARYATEQRVERRWKGPDYALRMDKVLDKARPKGRARRNVRKLNLPEQNGRTVSVTIGLDNISEATARNYINKANQFFKSYDITFSIRHIYQHQLSDGWRWPSEIRKMQQQTKSDIYLLLTPKEWLSERSGYIRGLGNYLFGAVMVQTGTDTQTIKRLMHEFGHLFGLRHTFLKGHIMYPNEKHIGLSWAPGSDRTLSENRFSTTWQTTSRYPERLNLAVKLAPPMVQRKRGTQSLDSNRRYTGSDVWAVCE